MRSTRRINFLFARDSFSSPLTPAKPAQSVLLLDFWVLALDRIGV
jgi:hypothetical protein